MISVSLHRVTFSADTPTYGMLLNHGIPLCLTLERAWMDNRTGISCIPPGVYPCVRHDTPTKPNCWEITGVPGRTSVLFHAGNSIADSEGCILVGLEIAGSNILKSQDALNQLRTILPDTFTLEIINPN